MWRKKHQCKVEKEEYEIVEEKWSCPTYSVKTTKRAIYPVLGSILQRGWGIPVRFQPETREVMQPFSAHAFGHICMSTGLQTRSGPHQRSRKQIHKDNSPWHINMSDFPLIFWPVCGNSDGERLVFSQSFSVLVCVLPIFLTLSEGHALNSTLLLCSCVLS